MNTSSQNHYEQNQTAWVARMRFITENLRIKDYNGVLKMQHYLPMSNPEMFSKPVEQIVAKAAITPQIQNVALEDLRPLPDMNVVQKMNNQEQAQNEQLEAARELIRDAHEFKLSA